MTTERYEQGLNVRKRVLGDEYVDRALHAVTAFDAPLQRLVTEYCWGEVWNRPGISDRQRSLNNLCLLAALNRPNEFSLHVRGALRNGCTLAEIRDTLLQITIYAGVPAGIEAFRLARAAIEAEGYSLDDESLQ